MAPGLLLWAIWNPRENLHATKKEESRTMFTEHRRTLEPRYPFNHQRVQRTQCNALQYVPRSTQSQFKVSDPVITCRYRFISVT